LRDRPCSLPVVPDLAAEEVTTRMEHLVSGSDTLGEKRTH